SIQMYGTVVLGGDHSHFEELLELHKEGGGVRLETELTADDWKKLVQAYKAKVQEELGSDFPQDAMEQLWGAIGAVFGSWNTARAVTYRKLHGIPEDWGTAVNVQAMVFGNMGQDCATGVAFTRNPSTGRNEFLGESPGQCPGQRRGGGPPHAEAFDDRGQAGEPVGPAGNGRSDACSVCRA